MIREIEDSTSIFDRFLFVLTRLAGRFDAQTINYMKENTGFDPTFDTQDGVDGRYKTTLELRRMMSSWRAADKLLKKPMKESELAELERQCDKALEGMKPRPPKKRKKSFSSGEPQNGEEVNTFVPTGDNSDYWAEVEHTVKVSTNIHALPILVGCLLSPSTKKKLVCGLLADTGASISIMPRDMLTSLGLSVANIQQDRSFKVSTALGVSKADGYVSLPVYLVDIQGNINRVFIKFVVLNTKHLNKAIIGIDSLVTLSYRMEYKHPQHTLTIWSVSAADKNVRRTYDLKNPTDSILFKNTSTLVPGSCHAIFTSDDLPAFNHSSNLVYSCNNSDVNISVKECGPPVYKCECDDDGHPIKIYSEMKMPVHTFTATHQPRDVEVRIALPDQEKDAMILKMFEVDSIDLLEDELNMLESKSFRVLEEAEEDSWVYCTDEEAKMDVSEPEDCEVNTADVLPPDPDLQEGEEDRILEETQERLDTTPLADGGSPLKTPDISHLPPEWRKRFADLFERYPTAFAQSSTDLGEVTALPPARVRARPNIAPRKEGQRRYAFTERKIIEEHIQEMIQAGVIEEVEYKDVDEDIIHWLHLVPKHSKTEKLDRSGQSGSRKSQLRAGNVRITHDLRK